MHTSPHPLAGKTITTVKPILLFDVSAGGVVPRNEFRIEDWWDHLTGGSWMFAENNPACIGYAIRSAAVNLPLDDEVVYVKANGIGHLVHTSELGLRDTPSA